MGTIVPDSLTDPWTLGSLRVPNRVLLAPLAGIGNWFVRLQAKRYGAGMAVSEMVSSHAIHHGNEQIFFGASVRYANDRGEERTVRIMGVDEAESARGDVSWISPVARALLRARVGDEVRLVTPGGPETLEVLEVSYPKP